MHTLYATMQLQYIPITQITNR